MYGIPSDFDPSVFVGMTLDQIAFTANSVMFIFDSGAIITVEGCLEFEDTPNNLRETLAIPPSSAKLLAVVGLQVEGAAVEQRDRLILCFPGSRRIGFCDDQTNYESFRIQVNGKEIVV